MYKLLFNNKEIPYCWSLDHVLQINNIKFIPILAVKCIDSPINTDKTINYIQYGEIYPVILICMLNSHQEEYLIINKFGNKHYFPASIF